MWLGGKTKYLVLENIVIRVTWGKVRHFISYRYRRSCSEVFFKKGVLKKEMFSGTGAFL